MRIAVIGGRGYLGSQVMRGLERASRVEAVAASRAGSLAVDLTAARSFDALQGFDAVVNCSDSVRIPPDALARWCLERGLLFVETSSDRVVVDRLLAGLRAPKTPPPAGGLLLGAGIFTGLSNVLGGDTARAVPGCERLELGIRFSPIARGGAGMVNLIAHLLDTDTITIEDGAPKAGPPVSRGPRLPFDDGPCRTLRLPFAEPAMLHASTGVPNIGVGIAPRPSVLRPLFAWTPLWLMRSRFFRAIVRFNMTLIRRVFFRWRTSEVTLSATATAPGGEASTTRTWRVNDGMLAAGFAVAAKLEAIAEAGEPPRGLTLPDERFTLDALTERMRRMAGDALTIRAT